MHVCFFPGSSHWTISCIRTITCEKLSALVHCNPDMENSAYHPVGAREMCYPRILHWACAVLNLETHSLQKSSFWGPLRLTEMDNSGSLLWRKLKVLNLSEMVLVWSLLSHSFQNSVWQRLGENEGPPCRLRWFLYLVLHQKHLASFWNYRFLGPESELQEMQTDNKLSSGSYLASKMKDQCFPPSVSADWAFILHACVVPLTVCIGWRDTHWKGNFCSVLIPGWCEIGNSHYPKGWYWSDCLMEAKTEGPS